MDPKVVVATLTWNQKADVLECLNTLTRMDYPNYEVVVVDNGSVDGTAEEIRRLYPKVRIVRHASNLGCAEGVNGEIRYAIAAEADYLFILANDAVVEPSTLSELIKAAQAHPDRDMFFPKVYYHQSNRIWFARGVRMDTEVDWLRGRFTNYVQNVEDDGSYDEGCDADLYPGGFCLISMRAIRKTGFLNPHYFIYFDDTEWLARMARHGFHGRYVPKARAWHKASSAFGMESPSFHYYRTRNRLYFYREFSPPGVFPRFMVLFFYEFLTDTAIRLFRSGMNAQLRAALWGIADFFRGKMGPRDLSGLTGKKLTGRSVQGNTPAGKTAGFTAKAREKQTVRVRLDWNLGDEIMHLPAFEVLRRKYPGARLEAVMRFPDLLKNNPFVDVVNPGPDEKPNLFLDLRREIRGKPRMERLKEVLKTDVLPLPKLYLADEEIKAARHQWKFEGRPVAAVSASARWFSRRWESQKWVELIHRFEEKGLRVLVLGSAGEELPAGENLTGQTSVRDAALILSQCSVFAGADSGLVHLALAAGTPTVGLYGPLNPDYLVTARPEFNPVPASVECRYCWSESRMLYPDHCPKIVPDCMSSISVEAVFESAWSLVHKEQSVRN